jgi:hypothetical protein
MLTVIMLGDELAQARARHEVIPRSHEAEQAEEKIERGDLTATQPSPDRRQLARPLHRLRTRRDERSIDRSDRGPDDDVRDDPALVKGVQHPDLARAQAGASGKDESGAIRTRAHTR